MPHDPELLAETRSWFLKGSRDLEAGAFELTAPSPFTEDAVFHAQHRVPFRKTHSLEELGAQCEAVDGELKPVIDKAVPLTKYAWEFRYPGESEAPSPEEAQAALAMAREVHDAVLARLPEQVRP